MEKGELSKFGFKVFRLKQANDSSEFLLVDTDKNKWYQYSYRRGLDMLKMNMEKICKMSMKSYMINEEYLDVTKATSPAVVAIFNDWVLAEITLIDNINYKPTDEELYKEDDYVYYNLYRKTELLKNKDTKEGNWDNIDFLFNNIVGGDVKGKIYFIKWLAWQIQNPQNRLATSIVLQGEQGSGKTLFWKSGSMPNWMRVTLLKQYGDS